MKYRKKPVVIEAYQLTQELLEVNLFNDVPLPKELRLVSASYHKGRREIHRYKVVIETLEGTMRAEVGDWIICGVAGEYYPCKPDIFESTYEEA